LGTLQLKIRNLSKTCRKSKASEAGIQVYVNIGFTLEGAYGTPGESRHVSESLYSRHVTLTVKQVLNAPCMPGSNRRELGCGTRNHLPSHSIRGCMIFDETIVAKASASSPAFLFAAGPSGFSSTQTYWTSLGISCPC